jgi:hypothetical protein
VGAGVGSTVATGVLVGTTVAVVVGGTVGATASTPGSPSRAVDASGLGGITNATARMAPATIQAFPFFDRRRQKPRSPVGGIGCTGGGGGGCGHMAENGSDDQSAPCHAIA